MWMDAMTKPNLSLEDRFMLYVQKSNDLNGCWEWTGGKNSDGYGSFNINQKIYNAHRVSYTLFVGDIQNSLFVCHSCDNPSCVNPSHLFLGTAQDNMTDKVNKNRQFRPQGEKSGNHKLTEQEIYEIREMRKCGYTLRKIANRFEVNFRTIHYITTDKRWKHLK